MTINISRLSTALVTLSTVLLCYVFVSSAYEFTFELPDKEKECFYEVVEKDARCVIEYQVITGGNYDVDMELVGPNGQVLYKEMRKQYDQFEWVANMKGEYRFCFSNEFSTFSHKMVYFDLQIGDEELLRITESDTDTLSAMTQMEASVQMAHSNLKETIDYQNHHRLRESQGRSFAESVNERVQYWSVGQTVIILIVGVGQVLVLRSFFSDKRSIHGSSMYGT